MEEISQDNPFVPPENKHIPTHVMNVNELQNKDKPKYIAKGWYDKLPYLLLIGISTSALLAGLSFLLEFLSFMIYLAPLPPILFFATWLVRRLFHGKNLEPIR
jgi:hypothetical protein